MSLSVEVQRANLISEARQEYLDNQEAKRLKAVTEEEKKDISTVSPSTSQLVAQDLELAKELAALEETTSDLTTLAYGSTISVVG